MRDSFIFWKIETNPSKLTYDNWTWNLERNTLYQNGLVWEIVIPKVCFGLPPTSLFVTTHKSTFKQKSLKAKWKYLTDMCIATMKIMVATCDMLNMCVKKRDR